MLHARHKQYLPAIMVLLLGFVLSLGSFSLVRVWENNLAISLAEVRFSNEASERTRALEKELEHAVDAVNELAAYINVVGSIENLREFSVHILSMHPVAQSLAWVPVVPAESADEFMEQNREYFGSAHIVERLEDGSLVRAVGRDQFHPVYVLTSFTDRVLPDGFDMGSRPLYRDAMAQARDSAHIAMTAPISRLHHEDPEVDLMVFMPLYKNGAIPPTRADRRNQIIGYVAGGFSSEKLVLKAITGSPLAGISLWIRDITDKNAITDIYNPRRLTSTRETRHVGDINVGSRIWRVSAVRPELTETANRSLTPWIVFLAGMVIASIIAWYMSILRRQTDTLQQTNQALSKEITQHQQAEVALRESESRFRKILESAGDGILIVDSEMKIIIANRQALQIFGYTESEFVGLDIAKLVPVPMQRAHKDYEQQYLDKPIIHTMGNGRELVGLRKDGTEIPVEISLSPLRSSEGMFVTAIVRDISERKQTEDRIHWLAEFPRLNPNPLMRVDGDGEILFANPASKPLLDYWRRTEGGWLPEPYFSQVQSVVKNHERLTTEIDIGDRVFHLVMASPQDTSIVNIYGLDISERKEAEETKERLSAIIQATTDFVGMADAETGSILYLNHAGREMVGVGPTDPVSDSRISDYLSDEGFSIANRIALPEACANGVWSGDLEFKDRKGQPIPVSAVIVAHDVENGKAKRFSCIARNISQQLSNERSLRKLNRTYEILSAANQALIHASSEYQLLDEFCSKLVDVGGYDLAWIGLKEGDGELMSKSYAGSQQDVEKLVEIIAPDQFAALRQSDTSSPIVIVNELNAFEATQWQSQIGELGYRSLVILTIARNGFHFGYLVLASKKRQPENENERVLLENLVNDLAVGVQSLHAHRGKSWAEQMLSLHNHALEASRNGVMICDASDDTLPIIYANPAFEEITGYSEREVIGKNPRFLQGSDIDQPELEKVRAAIKYQQSCSATLRNYRKDGSVFWNEFYLAPVRHDDDETRVTHYVGIINDITEHKRYEEELEYQAQHDELTGLPNRNLLQDRLDQALLYAKRHQRHVAVLFLDLDQFKVINDSLGHRIGDYYLKAIGERLRECINPEDTVARQGGDEFVVLLTDLERPEEINSVADRIMEEISKVVEIQGHRLQTTASIGATIYPRDGEDSATLLKNADAAMYRTKELGRNSINYFTEDLNQRLVERLTLERQLRRAIDNDELEVYYQPQINADVGEIIGMEALVRWNHPELGLVPPNRFIPLAEETGIILPLGDWVMTQACEQNRQWQEQGLPKITVSVNVSARQLEQPTFNESVAQILEASGLEARYLDLELTETTIMSDVDSMAVRLYALRDIGVHLSLDDFGTGYSSLSHLKQFNFDKLKIDKSFVHDIITETDASTIALTIIAMARSLNMSVVAEGVETLSQLRYLRRNGCHQIQGFYFSRPVPAQEATTMLEQGGFGLPEEDVVPALLWVGTWFASDDIVDENFNHVVKANTPDDAFDILAKRNISAVICGERLSRDDALAFLQRSRELYPDIPRFLISSRPLENRKEQEAGVMHLCLDRTLTMDAMLEKIRPFIEE